MFREDFEFHDDAGASHHGGKAISPVEAGDPVGSTGLQTPNDVSGSVVENGAVTWLADAEKELKRIPFFVRGKARRNTEAFASERGVSEISVETLYEAKAHFAR